MLDHYVRIRLLGEPASATSASPIERDGILKARDGFGITLFEGSGYEGRNVWYPVHRVLSIEDRGRSYS